MKTRVFPSVALWLLITIALGLPGYAQGVNGLKRDFPKADLQTRNVALRELRFDGTTRDSIPPIHDPVYRQVADVDDIGPFEPVISLVINGDARAYPLRIMLWHEIVNGTVGGVPVLVSYCPLCNSGVVFDRRLGGRALVFGNTGRIRHLDMVMYDKGSESFWQQFTGAAIVGKLTGKTLQPLPSRLESLASFRARAPGGRVLVPNDPFARPYGASPYRGMDTGPAPRLMQNYRLPVGIGATDYVVVIGNAAWPLKTLRKKGAVVSGPLTLRWQKGRNSIHDTQIIANGRDLGNVTVTNAQGDDVPHDVVFAFAFSAFRPQGEWMTGQDN